MLGPIVLGSSILFFSGIGFAYIALIPAALKFFISYGADVVEQLWSIDRYFEFVLLLLFSTGLAFQIPVIQLLLGFLGIVSSERMLSGWRYVVLGRSDFRRRFDAIDRPDNPEFAGWSSPFPIFWRYFYGEGNRKVDIVN